mmetsp:Transcript_693/g.1403  ORF Transcript_693/g.1403 Transcript_693/m.1403 type:complete len:222 (-) Transcript_693:971-1636(-)
MATVATGIPRGICTMLSRLSCPLSVLVFTGTPITGTGVTAASIPGRCAAPPAPATITSTPLAAAPRPCFISLSGVRWAETTSTSVGTPKRARTATASAMAGRSLSLPITTETSGGGAEGRPQSPTGSRRSMVSRARRGRSSSAGEGAVRFTWPILRPGRQAALPYQCTTARGTVCARSEEARVSDMEPEGAPRTFTMAAAPTIVAQFPISMPHTARRWFSN